MRELVVTRDGSHTLLIPEQGVMYHSVHGAIRESKHVFLEAGLRHVAAGLTNAGVAVFEMGFGTGLNAFLTAIYAMENKTPVYYTAVETAPLTTEEAAVLNYAETLGSADLFQRLHGCAWNEDVQLDEFFTLRKVQTDLAAFTPSRLYDLIYYDAFAPSAQPELWTEDVFVQLLAMLKPGGVLVTYCSKGDVRRALLAAGFSVEKLAGPPGKREMLRAWKP